MQDAHRAGGALGQLDDRGRRHLRGEKGVDEHHHVDRAWVWAELGCGPSLVVGRAWLWVELAVVERQFQKRFLQNRL